MIYAGIDSGANGGGGSVALIFPAGDVRTFDLVSWAVSMLPEESEIWMEQAGEIAKIKASKIFSAGQRYGEIIGTLHTLGVQYNLVPPQIWQSSLELREFENIKEIKRRELFVAEAKRRFKNAEVTLQNARALLIADYGRRQRC